MADDTVEPKCAYYVPDHNGECLHCDNWALSHSIAGVGPPEDNREAAFRFGLMVGMTLSHGAIVEKLIRHFRAGTLPTTQEALTRLDHDMRLKLGQAWVTKVTNDPDDPS